MGEPYKYNYTFYHRKQIQALKFEHKKDVESLLSRISSGQVLPSEKIELSTKSVNSTEPQSSKSVDKFDFRPIGFVQSCHASKNGSPRQPTVSPDSRGIIDIENMSTFSSKLNNVEYSLQNLEDFSHVWIIFVFHQNEENFVKTKVRVIYIFS